MNIRQMIAILTVVMSTSAQASPDMQTLLKKQCSSCHDDSLYTRADRKVQSLAGLQQQLKRCNHVIGSQLDDETLQRLTNYLNQKYYRF